MSRLTRKMVESRVQQLNELLNRPLTPFHYDESGNYVQHDDHLYVEVINERYYRLAMMCEHGATDIYQSHNGSLAELNSYISGLFSMYYGLRTSKNF
jgi:hypothetical protein